MANQIDLNKASPEELEKIPGVGSKRAEEIIQNRPYQNMEDLKRVPGFSDELIQTLQREGATVGSQ